MKGNETRGLDHQHLLIKEIKQEFKRYPLNIRDVLLEMNINYYDLTQEALKDVLHRATQNIKQTENYKSMQEFTQHKINEQIDNLFSTSTKRNLYLIDCLREATSFPFVKERDNNIFNFSPLYKQNISKELRRVIWTRVFNNHQHRQLFQIKDREITPYKIESQLKLTLEKIIIQENLNIKDNQRDIALRIMEYFVKQQQKIPHKYHNYVVLIVVQLYSYYTISKIIDFGAITLGIIGLIEYYYQPNSSLRFQKVMKAIQIIDPQSFQFIEQYYLSQQLITSTRKQFTECYQYFRLTMGACFLSLQTSQFIIDQLIFKKKCKFDMYVLFAIMILIISDQFEEKEDRRPSLKEVVGRAKTIVKPENYYQAYNAIYESIPAYYSADDLQVNPNNKLLVEMLSYERNTSEQPEQKQEDDFVINSSNQARIGSKI